MSPNLIQMHMSFCAKNGIKHALTPPYHPQSNGASETAVRKAEEAHVKQVLEGNDKDRDIISLNIVPPHTALQLLCQLNC